MRNAFLKDRTARDIDAQVAKILRDIGNPTAPLSLPQVRQLLRLDRHYYTTADSGVLLETVHKLTVAGQQVVTRPSPLLDIVKSCSLKALYLPDRKRILIDSSQPSAKQRWAEAHEICHSIIPWHQGMMLGDDRLTLKPACHDQLEAEANYATGQLLFLQGQLPLRLKDSKPSLKLTKELADQFGNTITTTLWRVVENLDFPAIGIICDHPHRPTATFDELAPCRYFIRSRTFEARFGAISEVYLFSQIKGYCSTAAGGPLGETHLRLPDSNGTHHLFHFETFFNRYEALTLGLHVEPAAIQVPVFLA